MSAQRIYLLRRRVAPLALLALSFQGHAADGEWQVTGSNTLRAETIDISGDENASPFPFDGGQYYNEFNLSVARHYSPYKFVRGEISGVWNESEYRSDENNFVPERIGLQVQNGEVGVPLRLDAGDFYANLSNRTLQRSLKGAQLELQPSFGGDEVTHSVILFSGTDQASWKDLEWSDNAYYGASWLVAGAWGEASANIIQNSFDSAALGDDLEQWVYSLTYGHDLSLGSENLDLAAEVSVVDGDSDFTGEDESGTGLYAEVTGRSDRYTALDYRLRYEDYDADFTPRGGVITPNRQSGEAFIGWRYDNGLYLQGRYQRFDDNADEGDTRETGLVGLRLTGPLLGSLAPGITGSLQAYSQTIESQSDAIDLDITLVDGNLSHQITDLWGLRLHGLLRDQNDNNASNLDQETLELGVAITRNFSWRELNGHIDVGVRGRHIDATGQNSNELNPTLRINLAGEKHSIAAAWGYLDQDRVPGDVATQTAGLDYSYRYKQHTFGADVQWIDRSAQSVEDTETLKAGIYWTYQFDRSNDGASDALAYALQQQIAPPPLFGQPLDSTLRQGLVFNAQLNTQTGFTTLGTTLKAGDDRIAYHQVLPEIAETQQLVLTDDGFGHLERLTLVIEPTGDSRDTQSAFDRTRVALIERLGTPDAVYEEGRFDAALAANLLAGEFRRLLVWHTATSTIQFGIPRRTDGAIRLEVQESAPQAVSAVDRMASISF